MMIRRGLVLLVFGSVLGVFFATFLEPRPLTAAEAPAELKAEPAEPTAAAKDLSQPFIRATKRVLPAVVRIVNLQMDFHGRLRQATSGSGFIVSKQGHILTNRHVVDGAAQIDVRLSDGRVFARARVLGKDPRSDIAVVQLTGLDPEGEDLPVATLGNSDSLQVAEWVIAIGAPFELESSVSVGVVSAKGRTGVLADRRLGTDGAFSEQFIQTDAALNPGNSGGPLINLDGQVVGINTAIETGGQIRANVGIGFAIPINLARTVAISLLERGIAKRGWLGISGHTLLPKSLREMGIRAPGGILIQEVRPRSPAAGAGLRPGDVVIAVDGAPVRSIGTLTGRLAQAGPGGKLVLKVRRGENDVELEAELGEEPLYTYGLEVADLTAESARSVGLQPNTQGVVITKVYEDTPASRGEDRLYPGDVILRIDSNNGRFRIRNIQDFRGVMNRFQAERPEVVRVLIAAEGRPYAVILRRDEAQ